MNLKKNRILTASTAVGLIVALTGTAMAQDEGFWEELQEASTDYTVSYEGNTFQEKDLITPLKDWNGGMVTIVDAGGYEAFTGSTDDPDVLDALEEDEIYIDKDSYAEQYRTRGLAGSLAVVPEWLEQGQDKDENSCYNADTLKGLASMGYDILDGSYSAKADLYDADGDSHDADSISEDLQKSDDWYREQGLRPTAFVYPCGYEELVKDAAAERYSYALQMMDGENWPEETVFANAVDQDQMNLKVLNLTDSSVDTVRQAIAEAAEQGEWLILGTRAMMPEAVEVSDEDSSEANDEENSTDDPEEETDQPDEGSSDDNDGAEESPTEENSEKNDSQEAAPAEASGDAGIAETQNITEEPQQEEAAEAVAADEKQQDPEEVEVSAYDAEEEISEEQSASEQTASDGLSPDTLGTILDEIQDTDNLAYLTFSEALALRYTGMKQVSSIPLFPTEGAPEELQIADLTVSDYDASYETAEGTHFSLYTLEDTVYFQLDSQLQENIEITIPAEPEENVDTYDTPENGFEVTWSIDSTIQYNVDSSNYSWELYDQDGAALEGEEVKNTTSAGYAFDGNGEWTGTAKITLTLTNNYTEPVSVELNLANGDGITLPDVLSSVTIDDNGKVTYDASASQATIAAAESAGMPAVGTITLTIDGTKICGNINADAVVGSLTVNPAPKITTAQDESADETGEDDTETVSTETEE